MNILEQSFEIDIRNLPLSEDRDEMLEKACSEDYDEANKGILSLQREIAENDLLHNDPEFCSLAVDVVLERGLKHENYTVQCASVGFLGEIVSKANGDMSANALDAVYRSINVVEDIVNNRDSEYYKHNENKKHDRWIRNLARRVYKKHPVIHR